MDRHLNFMKRLQIWWGISGILRARSCNHMAFKPISPHESAYSKSCRKIFYVAAPEVCRVSNKVARKTPGSAPHDSDSQQNLWSSIWLTVISPRWASCLHSGNWICVQGRDKKAERGKSEARSQELLRHHGEQADRSARTAGTLDRGNDQQTARRRNKIKSSDILQLIDAAGSRIAVDRGVF